MRQDVSGNDVECADERGEASVAGETHSRHEVLQSRVGEGVEPLDDLLGRAV